MRGNTITVLAAVVALLIGWIENYGFSLKREPCIFPVAGKQNFNTSSSTGEPRTGGSSSAVLRTTQSQTLWPRGARLWLERRILRSQITLVSKKISNAQCIRTRYIDNCVREQMHVMNDRKYTIVEWPQHNHRLWLRFGSFSLLCLNNAFFSIVVIVLLLAIDVEGVWPTDLKWQGYHVTMLRNWRVYKCHATH